MKMFVKYQNFWWEYREDSSMDNARLYNIYGGYFCNADIRAREIVYADSFQELDWSGTDVLNKNSRYGWVDRRGNFYGCSYESHELQAFLVHQSDKNELEKLGWIHISAPSKKDAYVINAQFWGDYKNGVMPTDAQMQYLLTRNDVQFSQVMEAYECGNREKARIYENNLNKSKNFKIEDTMEM